MKVTSFHPSGLMQLVSFCLSVKRRKWRIDADIEVAEQFRWNRRGQQSVDRWYQSTWYQSIIYRTPSCPAATAVTAPHHSIFVSIIYTGSFNAKQIRSIARRYWYIVIAVSWKTMSSSLHAVFRKSSRFTINSRPLSWTAVFVCLF